MRSRVVSGIALLAALGVSSARAAGNGTQIGTPERALDRVEARVDGVRADVAAARERSDTPPPSLRERLEEVRAGLADAIEGLQGQPWATAEPLLRREARLRRSIEALRRDLDDWPTAADRRVSRPAERAVAGTGAISGRVTDGATAAPIEDVYVAVYDSSGYFVESAYTDATGLYLVEGLDAGIHFVLAEHYDYHDELYDNLPCEFSCDVTTGTPVPVADGQTTAGIHFALLPLSRISGRVTDASTGAPLAGVDVTVYTASGLWAGSAYSDSTGAWEVERLGGGIYFALASSSLYLDELYEGIPCEPSCTPASGTQILVPAHAHVPGIDFPLSAGGSVSGRVTDSVSGEPIEYVQVGVYNAAAQLMAYVQSDEAGRYQAFDLPTGTYFARTSGSSGHADELFDDIPCEPTCSPAQGTPIAVTAGQERPGVDFALTPLGSVAGTVTDAGAGTPVRGVSVSIVNAQGSYSGSASTDESGRYRLGGLPAGTYFLFTENGTYVDELYDGFPCEPSCTPTSGTPVPVTLGNQTSGIDFALDFGGWVTGTVRSQATALPIAAADVWVFTATGTEVDRVSTDATGRYVVAGLKAGTYFAYAQTFDHLRELYRELPCPAGCSPITGTPIPVAIAQESGGIDFTLVRLGRIEGRITDAANGLPIDFAEVDVYNASGQMVTGSWSGPSGWYTIDRLAAGTYYVRTDAYQHNVVDELYDNITCEPTCTVTTGTPVVVALDATTGGIDFALRRPIFADVPVTHFAWRAVEAVHAAGITSGCATAPLRFCPDAGVNRAQMAVFLLTAKEGAGYLPPPALGIFDDVPAADPFARWIEELANRGIASGCSANPPLYCPAAPTTRAQMAPLLLLTREGTGYLPPGAVGVFQDVPPGDPFARWIEELVRRRVTSGCSVSPPLYCPGQATTRSQMAVFLASMFAVPLP